MFGALGLLEALMVGTLFATWISIIVVCALTETGDRRVAWMIAVIFVPFLGSVAYLAVRLLPRLAAPSSSSGVRS